MVSLDIIVICEFDSRNSNLQRVLLPKDLLRYGRNTRPNLVVGSFHLGAKRGTICLDYRAGNRPQLLMNSVLVST